MHRYSQALFILLVLCVSGIFCSTQCTGGDCAMENTIKHNSGAHTTFKWRQSLFKGSHPPVVKSETEGGSANHKSSTDRKREKSIGNLIESKDVSAKSDSKSKYDSNESAEVTDDSVFDDGQQSDDYQYYYYEYEPTDNNRPLPPQAHHSHSVLVPNHDQYYYYYYDDEQYHYSAHANDETHSSSISKMKTNSNSDSQKHESEDRSSEKSDERHSQEKHAKKSIDGGNIDGIVSNSNSGEVGDQAVQSESTHVRRLTPMSSVKRFSSRNYSMLLIFVAIGSSIASILFYEIIRRLCKDIIRLGEYQKQVESECKKKTININDQFHKNAEYCSSVSRTEVEYKIEEENGTEYLDNSHSPSFVRRPMREINVCID